MAWYNSNWKYRRRIEIDSNLVAGNTNLFDFQVLVDFTDESFTGPDTHPNAWDIVFTSEDGTTKIPHDIELQNRSTGRLLAWVKVPTVNANTPTRIFCYYGNPSVGSSQEDAPNTWPDGEFVYHLNENPVTQSFEDSSGNGRLANPSGFITGDAISSGKIDGAINSNCSSSRQIIGTNTASINPTIYVLDFWMLFKECGLDHYIIDKGNIGLTTQVTTNRTYLEFRHRWSGDDAICEADITEDGQWHKIHIQYDGSSASNFPQIFIDGVEQTTNIQTPTGSIIASTTDPWTILNSTSTTDNNYIPTLSGDVLFIRQGATTSAAEQEYITFLTNLGFTVTVVQDTVATLADANGKVLIVAPSEITSGDLGNLYRDTAVPFLTWEAFLADDYEYTTTNTFGTTGGANSIYITRSDHHVADNNPIGSVTVYPVNETRAWFEDISAGGIEIATLTSGQTQTCIAVWEVGKDLADGFVAQARRGYFFFTDNGLADANAAGEALFQRMIEWLVGAYENRSPNIELDEVRLAAGTVDTADYILTEYRAENDPTSFAGVQAKELESQPWLDLDWTHRRRVQIQHEEVAGNLTDFVLLVELTDEFLAEYAKSDGTDIFFTEYFGTTKLEHEITSYDSVTGTLQAWVKVPSLSSTEDTFLYMYFGNPIAPDQQQISATWNDYEAVWHMEEDPSTEGLFDSTGNIPDGTFGGGMNTADKVAGLVGDGIEFDGTDDRVNVGNINPGAWTGLTLEAWVYKTGPTSGVGERVICQSPGTSVAGHTFAIQLDDSTGANTPSPAIRFSTDLEAGEQFTSNVAFQGLNIWTHIAATWESSNGDVILYTDGVASGTFNKPGNTVDADTVNDTIIGALLDGSGPRNIDAILDEIRISSKARSGDEILTQYNMTESPAQFFTSDFLEATLWEYEATGPATFAGAAEVSFERKFIWKYRIPITINASEVEGTTDFTDFPILIDTDLPNDVQDHILDNARTLGQDFVFTADDGETKLSHEIEYYNASTGRLYAWVKINNLSATTDTEIFLYYGHSTVVDQQAVDDTWPTKYLAVYHMHDVPGVDPNQSDSSGNGEDASFNGSMTFADSVAGKVYNSLDFDGSNDYLNTGFNPLTNNSFTISAWTRRDTSSSQEMVIGQSSSGTGDESLHFGYRASNFFTFAFWSNDLDSSSTYTDTGGTFHKWTGTYDASNNERILYRDGVQESTDIASADYAGTDNLWIGGMGGQAWDFDGEIDEVRIISGIQDPDWELTEFRNIDDPNTFSTIGQPEAHWKNEVGTVILSGAADVELELERDTSGGMVFAGDADADTEVESVYVPTGGLITSGEADVVVFVIPVYEGSGGLIAAGEADYFLDFILYFVSGGAILSGAIDNPELEFSYEASGSAVFDGEAEYTIEFDIEAAGSIVISGDNQDYLIGYIFVAIPISLATGGGEYFIEFVRIGSGSASFDGTLDPNQDIDLELIYVSEGGGFHVGSGESDIEFSYEATGSIAISGEIDFTIIDRIIEVDIESIILSGISEYEPEVFYVGVPEDLILNIDALTEAVYNWLYVNVVQPIPLKFKGAAATTHTRNAGEYEASGAIQLKSLNTQYETFYLYKNYNASGEVVISGSIKFDFIDYDYVASGKTFIVSSTTAERRLAFTWHPSNGPELNGSAISTIDDPAYIYEASGNLTTLIDHIAEIEIILDTLGNALLSASPLYFLVEENTHKASGLAYFNPIDTEFEVGYIYSTISSSLTLGGFADTTLEISREADGSANFNGQSDYIAEVSAVYVSSGVLNFDGIADTEIFSKDFIYEADLGLFTLGASNVTYTVIYIYEPVIIVNPAIGGAIPEVDNEYIYDEVDIPIPATLSGTSPSSFSKIISYTAEDRAIFTAVKAPSQVTVNYTGSGSITFAGIADTLYDPIFEYLPTEGIIISGAVDTLVTYLYPDYASTGTAFITGVANYFLNDNYKASGGIFFSGESDFQIGYVYKPIGVALVFSGVGETEQFHVFEYDAIADTIIISGSANTILFTANFIYEPSGGGISFGLAESEQEWTFVTPTPTGGLTFNGDSEAEYTINYNYGIGKIFGKIFVKRVGSTNPIVDISINATVIPDAIEIDGLANSISELIYIPNEGIIIGGEAAIDAERLFEASGGILVRQVVFPKVEYSYYPIYDYTATGVALSLIGGLYTISLTAPMPTGGAVFGGAVLTGETKNEWVYRPFFLGVDQGGAVFASDTFADTEVTANYNVIPGDEINLKFFGSLDSYGDPPFNDIPSLIFEIEREGSGSIEIDGTNSEADYYPEIKREGVGGVIIDGQADYSYLNDYSYVPIGGIILSGQAVYIHSKIIDATILTTAIVLSGSAGVEARSRFLEYFPTGDDAIILSGAALTEQEFEYTYIAIIPDTPGQITKFKGVALVEFLPNPEYIYDADGGLTTSGAATTLEFGNGYIYNGSGKAVLSGIALTILDDQKDYEYEASGQLKFNVPVLADYDPAYIKIGVGGISIKATFTKVVAIYNYPNYDAIPGAITLGGSADSTHNNLYEYLAIPATIVLSGIAITTHDRQYFYGASGQVNFNGIAEYEYNAIHGYNITGGIFFAGSSAAIGTKLPFEYIGNGSLNTSGDISEPIRRYTILKITNGTLASEFDDSEERVVKAPLASRNFRFDLTGD